VTDQQAAVTPLVPRRRRGGGRVPILTREHILDTAERFAIADLSMPALAAQLGVTHSAIYYYFPSRADLLAAMANQAAQRLAPPPRNGQEWDVWLIDAALALRELFIERPHIGDVVSLGGVALGTPFVEAIVAVALDAGFTPEQAVDVVQLVSACSLGGAVAVRQYRSNTVSNDALMDDMKVAEDSPLRSVSRALADYDPEAGFRRAIATVIDGLRLQLEAAVRRR
jgi:AcrR family transcriptional regulator